MTRDTGKLLDFITTAFYGEELGRVPLEDGSVGHAEIRVGDTILLAFMLLQVEPGRSRECITAVHA